MPYTIYACLLTVFSSLTFAFIPALSFTDPSAEREIVFEDDEDEEEEMDTEKVKTWEGHHGNELFSLTSANTAWQ
jgi:hypothetical protein